jgi:hypothetical protein
MLRRVLIVLFGLFLVIDLGLLYVVKSYLSTATHTVTVSTDKPEVAEKIKAKIEAAGFRCKVEDGAQIIKLTPKGFKVAYHNRDHALYAPVIATLKQKKITAKEVNGDLVLKVVATQKEANEAQKAVKDFGFTVSENLVSKPAKGSIVSAVVTEDEVATIQQAVEELKVVRKEDIRVTGKSN